ncbi:MAG: 16S rRNA (cytidine(1402)-2'-O)-methyltransferase [Candidatus Paceibacterota bacterium]
MKNKKNFYVVATPIGNLDDISKRAQDVLSSVEVIFAEDTRVTKKLLNHYNIKTPVYRYNEHNPEKTFEDLYNLFRKGSIALTSDAGTPSISDPGGVLVDFVRKNFPNIKIEVIPGPSALVSAVSVSGLPSSSFTFLGFPPLKNKRNKFFENIKNIEVKPVIFYESPHRLQKTFDNIEEILGDIDIFIAKEMTKIYEDYFNGKVSEARKYFSGDKGKGEFVVIIP